jgi:DNA primase
MTNIYKNITNICKDLLYSFPEAKEVLSYADSRISRFAQNKFEFGYFPSFENLNVLISALGEENLIKEDLFYYKIVSGRKELHSRMENHNLILPYKDVYGNIIAMVGRTLLPEIKYKEKDIPKYKNTIFKKSKHLFGLYEAKTSILKKNVVFILEGQMDVISAQDKGMENVVALGSSSMAFDQLVLLTRYTENIIVMLDNDDAGKVGAKKILNDFGKFANIKIAELPKGYKDLDEFFATNDLESLEIVLKK